MRPCELVGWLGFLAVALIVVLTTVACAAALRDRLWLTLAALAAVASVPLVVGLAYGQGRFN